MTIFEFNDEYSIHLQKQKIANKHIVLIDYKVLLMNDSLMSLNMQIVLKIKENNKGASFVFIFNKDIHSKKAVKDVMMLISNQLYSIFKDDYLLTIIVNVNGFYRLPFSGFNEIFIKYLNVFQIDSFICTDLIENIRFCFNENITYILDVENDNGHSKHHNYNVYKKDIEEIGKYYVNKYPDDIVSKLKKLTNTLIITIGPPGIGKTTFVNKIQGFKLGYIRASISNKQIRTKVSNYVDAKSNENEENIIIDCLNTTINDRSMFINCCSMIKMKCICVFFDVPKTFCIFNNAYNFDKCKGTISQKKSKGVTRYYNMLQKPKLSEGFEHIYNILNVQLEGKESPNKLY
jgi:predicted kinase